MSEKDYPYNNPLFNCYVDTKEADICDYKKNKAVMTLSGLEVVT